MNTFSLIEDIGSFGVTNKNYKKDRNTSILEFNMRLFDFACRDDVPIMEKINFINIIFKNLDEFVSVRLSEISKELVAIYIKSISKMYTAMNEELEKIILHYRYEGFSVPVEPKTTTKDGKIFYVYKTSKLKWHMVRFVGSKPEFLEKVSLYEQNDPNVNNGFFVRFISDKSFRYVYSGEELTDLTTEIEEMCLIKNKEIFNYLQTTSINTTEVNNFCESLGLKLDEIIQIPETLLFIEYLEKDMKKKITSISQYYPKATPKYEKINYIQELKKRDILISNPFDSYQHVLDFIYQCCNHTEVKWIYMSLYRVAPDSKIVDSLIDAANSGKQVYLYIEPTARGNEEANIALAKRLDCPNIFIGFNYYSYKVHAKVFTAVLNSGESYSCIGTGNFNENTAKVYTDMHLLTCSNDVSAKIFNIGRGTITKDQILPYEPDTSRVATAPINLKRHLLNLIEREIAKGPNGRIIIKCNSLCDIHITDFLYRAASVGVYVKIIFRTACTMTPRENLVIKSKVGRYLQHDRFYVFGNRVFIASADLLMRNLSKRIETMCEITDAKLIQKIFGIFDSIWNCSDIHRMNKDGSWDWDKE